MMDTLVTRFIEDMGDNQALLQLRRKERRQSVRPEVKARGRAGEKPGNFVFIFGIYLFFVFCLFFEC